MTEYSKLKEKGMGRGRPKHTAEQKAAAEIKNRARTESRRRAVLVLVDRHREEFQDISDVEFLACVKEIEAAMNKGQQASASPKKSSKSTRK
jgi:hypothetical protein